MDIQGEEIECYHGLLQPAFARSGSMRRASTTSPVLGREDERSEPEIGQDMVYKP